MAHLPLAAMQAQYRSHLPTEASASRGLPAPCSTQAWDSHQPTVPSANIHLPLTHPSANQTLPQAICSPSTSIVPTCHYQQYIYQHIYQQAPYMPLAAYLSARLPPTSDGTPANLLQSTRNIKDIKNFTTAAADNSYYC